MHRAEAETLLQRDRAANGIILCGGQRVLRDFVPRETRAGLKQRLRAQQTANVLGAEGWLVPRLRRTTLPHRLLRHASLPLFDFAGGELRLTMVQRKT